MSGMENGASLHILQRLKGQNTVRERYRQLYTNTFDHLNKIHKSLKTKQNKTHFVKW